MPISNQMMETGFDVVTVMYFKYVCVYNDKHD